MILKNIRKRLHVLQYNRADRKNWEAKMNAPLTCRIISCGESVMAEHDEMQVRKIEREEGHAEGVLEKAKEVFENLIAAGMSKEQAVSISGYKPA